MPKTKNDKLSKFFAGAFREVVLPSLDKMSDNINEMKEDTKETNERLERIEDKLIKIDDRLDRHGKVSDNHEKRITHLEAKPHALA